MLCWWRLQLQTSSWRSWRWSLISLPVEWTICISRLRLLIRIKQQWACWVITLGADANICSITTLRVCYVSLVCVCTFLCSFPILLPSFLPFKNWFSSGVVTWMWLSVWRDCADIVSVRSWAMCVAMEGIRLWWVTWIIALTWLTGLFDVAQLQLSGGLSTPLN